MDTKIKQTRMTNSINKTQGNIEIEKIFSILGLDSKEKRNFFSFTSSQESKQYEEYVVTKLSNNTHK